MTLDWVLKVLKAKGLDQTVINRLYRLYANNLTVVVVNDIPGKCFKNNYMSIRQGDRPSSTLFCFGIDPHIAWLERRLKGILIYKQSAEGPTLPGTIFRPQVETRYKIIGYIDDIKPAVTSMNEFQIIDRGAALFEGASGCALHRDSLSGKVKLLPLGRWKGSLQQEDLPVNYIALSDHLDMVGVQLMSTTTKTRKINGDSLTEKVKKIIGSWKGGKFMDLTLRSHSVNTYCLSKVWFKCRSTSLRVGDIDNMNSNIKSWLFSDQLEQPGEIALYRSRGQGGLGLYNIKYKAMAELIRAYLETAVNTEFLTNQYHNALFNQKIEEVRVLPAPPTNPFLPEEAFENIKVVKEEGRLNIFRLSSGDWYRVLLENNITMTVDESGRRILKPCKVEMKNPDVNWEITWRRASLPGLSSADHSFLWKMLHNVLPTHERLHRLGMNNIISPLCSQCDQAVNDDLPHALVTCPQNKEVIDWLLNQLVHVSPNICPHQLVLLSLADLQEEHELPVTWLISQTLSYIWTQRIIQKKPTLFQTRALLEAGVSIMRKSRFYECSNAIKAIIER